MLMVVGEGYEYPTNPNQEEPKVRVASLGRWVGGGRGVAGGGGWRAESVEWRVGGWWRVGG